MTKRKVNIIFAIVMATLILAFLISSFLFPAYMGEDEKELLDIVPENVWFIFTVPILIVIIFLQLKYRLIIIGYTFNYRLFKMLGSLIVLPVISFFISFIILFSYYSFYNFLFVDEKSTIGGIVYKMEIVEGPKVFGNHILYFDENNKYRLSLSKKDYDKFDIGDKIELYVLKGRLSGYYLLSFKTVD